MIMWMFEKYVKVKSNTENIKRSNLVAVKHTVTQVFKLS
jgi:hypothetical protein